MAEEDRFTRVIDERFATLTKDLSSLIAKVVGAADCGCLLDYGCCNDKGCCGDKGCCKQKSDDPSWDEFINIAERLGISVEALVARVNKLDPKLLKA